jgi:hypothetical protein
MPKGEDPNEFRPDEVIEYPEQFDGTEILTRSRDVDDEAKTSVARLPHLQHGKFD